MMACEGRRPGDDDQSALTHRCRTDCVCARHALQFNDKTNASPRDATRRDACSHWRRLRRQIPARFRRRTTLTDWLNDVIPSLSIPLTGVSPFHSKRLPAWPGRTTTSKKTMVSNEWRPGWGWAGWRRQLETVTTATVTGVTCARAIRDVIDRLSASSSSSGSGAPWRSSLTTTDWRPAARPAGSRTQPGKI